LKRSYNCAGASRKKAEAAFSAHGC
jgi:hypothetical protein